ncbi:MAG: allantoicase [Bacteroidia bacterium]
MKINEGIAADAPAWAQLLNLAAEKLGAKVLYATDDFFAEKENLIKPGRGIFIPDEYTDRGKWMDGWESRRKRVPGHDWAILELGASGVIHGVDIDTNHFLGNHPPHASLEACRVPEGTSLETLMKEETWTEILPKSPLNPGSQHYYAIESREIWTHLRLHIFPDGGVARLKVYGEVFKDWSVVSETETIDLAAAKNGAKVLTCNDMFFSSKDNLIMPNRGVNMGDGWETKRNRTPGNVDWVILQLAHRGTIDEALVDTCHFKGNYPDRCSLEGCDLAAGESWENANWTEFLPQVKLQADHEHPFKAELSAHGPFTHVRMKIYPDGGVSRLRLWGKIVK